MERGGGEDLSKMNDEGDAIQYLLEYCGAVSFAVRGKVYETKKAFRVDLFWMLSSHQYRRISSGLGVCICLYSPQVFFSYSRFYASCGELEAGNNMHVEQY